MSQPVTITTADVPSTYCPQNIQEAWPFLVSLLLGETNNSAYNFGSTIPAPDDQDKPWLRLNANGTMDRWYVYSGGAWVAKHPVAPGTVIMYEGTEASIPTFDGGEAGVVTETTGPMWERATEFDARFPIGVGTLPSTTALLVGGTGGEEEHELTLEEIPAHDHNLDGKNLLSVNAPAKTVDLDFSGTDAGGIQASSEGGDVNDETVPHNNMPPYRVVFFLRKTARTQYRI